MPLTLIQLVSEQTMPNLLPLLRLRPARVLHLATPRTAPRSAWIVEAARQAGLQPEVELITLSAMPSMPETFNAVREAIRGARQTGLTPLVNFTGGTKLMSIGAYAAALHSAHPAPSLYVDTDDEAFVDGGTDGGIASLFENDFSFTPLRQDLTVHIIAVANGRQQVTAGRDWRPWLPLAQYLSNNPGEERAAQDAIFGKSGLLPGAQWPKTPDQWLALLDREFPLPAGLARLAWESGLVIPSPSGACRLPDATRAELQALVEARARGDFLADYDRRRIAATEAVQFPINLLTGGWWEVIVADATDRSGRFRDIRWSASVIERGGGGLEEDVLAVDGVQVVCISCKRGGDKARLLPHLEELNARARSIGGNFTHRFLAVYLAPKSPFEKQLRSRAQSLGIGLLTPREVLQPTGFAGFRAPH
jgi:hypothetical protein